MYHIRDPTQQKDAVKEWTELIAKKDSVVSCSD